MDGADFIRPLAEESSHRAPNEVWEGRLRERSDFDA